MKTLINNIKTFLETAITATEINAVIVKKGLPEDPQQVPFNNYPYIALGDAGERTEVNESETAQNRTYSVIVVMAVYNTDVSTALDNILDLCDQVKTVFEKEVNRQKDGIIWGLNIEPFDWRDERGYYMGRTVTVEYRELEETYMRY